MEGYTISRVTAAQAARLDKTVTDLQSRLTEHEAALEKVHLLNI